MKRARWGRCKHCQALAFHKCHRCGSWLCAHGGAPCGRLRRVAREVGRYDLVCWPRCRKTRSDAGSSKAWWKPAAFEHSIADLECGRDWACACGACSAARAAGWEPG